jgi:alanine-alpha-ketoisovalerate/valine-pyruvate aminotransferase
LTTQTEREKDEKQFMLRCDVETREELENIRRILESRSSGTAGRISTNEALIRIIKLSARLLRDDPSKAG